MCQRKCRTVSTTCYMMRIQLFLTTSPHSCPTPSSTRESACMGRMIVLPVLTNLRPISLTPAGDINGTHCVAAHLRALLFVSAIVLDHRFSNLDPFWQTRWGTRDTRVFMTPTAFLFRVSTLDGGFLTRIPLCPPSWASSHSGVRQLEQLHVKRPLLSRGLPSP